LFPTLISTDIDEDSVEDLLMHSLHSIDSEISVVTDEEVEKRGMGTTLTALLIRDKIHLFATCGRFTVLSLAGKYLRTIEQ
jgi:serine/threonine protein phosphatase PrpC